MREPCLQWNLNKRKKEAFITTSYLDCFVVPPRNDVKRHSGVIRHCEERSSPEKKLEKNARALPAVEP